MNRETEDEGWVDLTPVSGFIRVSGSDAGAFLQAQFCNDVTLVSDTITQISGWCNPKGRLLAVLRLLRDGEAWFIVLPAELMEPTLRRLRMFVLRSAVVLEDQTGTWGRLGLWGEDAPGQLAALLEAEPPQQTDACVRAGASVVVRVAGITPRFELIGPAADIDALRERLAGRFPAADTGAWTLQDIRAGLPFVHAATREMFVPQMVNLDLVGGLSFTKGCYPGQEIVARTHYLGKLKRRMYRLGMETNEPPAPGDPVFNVDRTTGEPAGQVVLAARAGDGRAETLAMLRIEDALGGTLHVGTPEGPHAIIDKLPYEISTTN